jgi:hypothetical protein
VDAFAIKTTIHRLLRHEINGSRNAKSDPADQHQRPKLWMQVLIDSSFQAEADQNST